MTDKEVDVYSANNGNHWWWVSKKWNDQRCTPRRFIWRECIGEMKKDRVQWQGDQLQSLGQSREDRWCKVKNRQNLVIHSEKAMAPHSSTLAWKLPWTEEPGGLQSMGSRRVRHDWATSLSLFTFMHWRRKRQPTPVFLPGESQGRGSLLGCRLWGRTESDTTEAT